MASEIGPLINTNAAPGDAAGFQTAVFYSISNCQPGLRGVSLGNFLIKQVVDKLSGEFPRIKEFCTLSPIPGFREWLKASVARGFAPADKRATPKLRKALAAVTPQLGAILAATPAELRAPNSPIASLKQPLSTLCGAYLLGVGEPAGTSGDAVARFHLNNGARLERLNWQSDESDKGLKQALGMMVNYVYEPKRIERNHEQFVKGKTIASGAVEGLI